MLSQHKDDSFIARHQLSVTAFIFLLLTNCQYVIVMVDELTQICLVRFSASYFVVTLVCECVCVCVCARVRDVMMMTYIKRSAESERNHCFWTVADCKNIRRQQLQ